MGGEGEPDRRGARDGREFRYRLDVSARNRAAITIIEIAAPSQTAADHF
jgi:hypothetical protein